MYVQFKSYLNRLVEIGPFHYLTYEFSHYKFLGYFQLVGNQIKLNKDFACVQIFL